MFWFPSNWRCSWTERKVGSFYKLSWTGWYGAQLTNFMTLRLVALCLTSRQITRRCLAYFPWWWNLFFHSLLSFWFFDKMKNLLLESAPVMFCCANNLYHAYIYWARVLWNKSLTDCPPWIPSVTSCWVPCHNLYILLKKLSFLFLRTKHQKWAAELFIALTIGLYIAVTIFFFQSIFYILQQKYCNNNRNEMRCMFA